VSRTLLAITLIMSLVGCSRPAYIEVTGTITDDKTGDPISAATVCFERSFSSLPIICSILNQTGVTREFLTTRTDARGHFRFQQVIKYPYTRACYLPYVTPKGRFASRSGTINVVAPGYVPFFDYLHDQMPETLDIDLSQRQTTQYLPQGRIKLDHALRTSGSAVYINLEQGAVVTDQADADVVLMVDGFSAEDMPHMFGGSALLGADGRAWGVWKLSAAGDGGIAVLPMRQKNVFEELDSCEDLQFLKEITGEQLVEQPHGEVFCVRTRDGKHYAKIQFGGGVFWVYQPNGSANVATAIMQDGGVHSYTHSSCR